MLIVEGPDGCGKTTLVQKLHEALGWPIAPKSVSGSAKAMVDIPDYIFDQLEKGWHEEIYDRDRLISAPIYGSVGVGPNEFLHPVVRWQEWLRKMNAIQPIIVYCIVPYEVMLENLTKDEESFATMGEHAFTIYHQYVNRAVQLNDGFVYDYTDQFADFRLGEFIHRSRHHRAEINAFTQFANLLIPNAGGES